MDVERIQKINAMAMELLRKGMATDRQDAVTQAEKFFKDLSGDTQALKITKEGSSESRIVEQKAAFSGAASSAAQQVALSSDKIQEILEKNSQFLVKTIKEFQGKITALEGEVSSLKQKMLFSRSAEPAHNPAPTAKPAASSESTSHPRTGSYKQEEVSIEKYFYMGGKK